MSPPRLSAPIQDPAEPAAPAPARPSPLLLPFDPILLLAVLGLCAGSLVTIAGATADDVPGQPSFYLERQAAFVAVGTLVAALISRLDYSRLREVKYAIYGFLFAAIAAVQLFGSVTRAAAGDPDRVLLLPGVRAGKGPAHRGVVGLRGGPLAAAAEP
jgi:rod shape determining protein RodA